MSNHFYSKSNLLPKQTPFDDHDYTPKGKSYTLMISKRKNGFFRHRTHRLSHQEGSIGKKILGNHFFRSNYLVYVICVARISKVHSLQHLHSIVHKYRILQTKTLMSDCRFFLFYFSVLKKCIWSRNIQKRKAAYNLELQYITSSVQLDFRPQYCNKEFSIFFSAQFRFVADLSRKGFSSNGYTFKKRTPTASLFY